MIDVIGAHKPRFTPLEVILCLGVGFIIRPLIDAFADRDYIRGGIAIVYLVFAYRRIMPRLPSLAKTS